MLKNWHGQKICYDKDVEEIKEMPNGGVGRFCIKNKMTVQIR